jgi:hypothetical protein
MIIKLKKKTKGAWRNVQLKEITGSLINYIDEAEFPVAASIYKDGEVAMILSNNESVLDAYEGKGIFLLHSDDAVIFLGDRPVHESIAEVFPDSDFIAIQEA